MIFYIDESLYERILNVEQFFLYAITFHQDEVQLNELDHPLHNLQFYNHLKRV
jgi:hypothetical protein